MLPAEVRIRIIELVNQTQPTHGEDALAWDSGTNRTHPAG